MNHRYKDEEAGRGLEHDLRTRVRYATLQCSHCPEAGKLAIRVLLPPELIDKKFQQKGWELDPHVCPDCIRKRKKARTAASVERRTKPEPQLEPEVEVTIEEQPTTMLEDNPTLREVSANTHKASAMMHKLLNHHFDADEGRYEAEWGDERIAQETGLSVKHIAEIRVLAYGDIKEPEAITNLRGKIDKLETDITEMMAVAQREMLDLKRQLNDTCKKLGVRA